MGLLIRKARQPARPSQDRVDFVGDCSWPATLGPPTCRRAPSLRVRGRLVRAPCQRALASQRAMSGADYALLCSRACARMGRLG